MALTNCTECNREVSTSAAACPHCGAPRKQERSRGRRIIRGLFIAWTLFVGGFWVLTCSQAAVPSIADAATDAELTGATLGMLAGGFVYLMVWGVGAVVLYLIRRLAVD